jgi:hypothetical protein
VALDCSPSAQLGHFDFGNGIPDVVLVHQAVVSMAVFRYIAGNSATLWFPLAMDKKQNEANSSKKAAAPG